MCEFCDSMRKWYDNLPNRMREAGFYLEFGAALQVRQMYEGKEYRFIIDKSVPKITFCPVCGAKIEKLMQKWRKDDMRGLLEVQTSDGIRINVLPDDAKCKITGTCPLEMDNCPIYNFDDRGDVCVPEMCVEYEEDGSCE